MVKHLSTIHLILSKDSYQTGWIGMISTIPHHEKAKHYISIADYQKLIFNLKIIKIFEHKLPIFSYALIFNICFGCLKEPSHRDGSFEHS